VNYCVNIVSHSQD